MNRPSPDDMNEIIMDEQREEIKELEEENKELKNKCNHLTKIITYIMDREDICYIDDGEYGFQIAE